jgi:GTP-binding protein
MDALDAAAVVYQVVLTKGDKVPAAEQPDLMAAVSAALAKRPAAHPTALLVSAHLGAGVDVLRAEVAALAAPALPAP